MRGVNPPVQIPNIVPLSKGVLVVAFVGIFLLTVSSLVLTTIAWEKLHAPMTTNVTNNEYKNQSQWQATVVFPNGGIPMDIEHFVYDPEPHVGQFAATNKMNYLSNRCLWWLETSIPNYSPHSGEKIITCFKEKQKK